MKTAAHRIAFALTASLVASPVLADPHIHVTGSETLSLVALRVRTTFEVSVVGDASEFYYGFSMNTRYYQPSANLFECQAPAGWHCGHFPADDSMGAYFYPDAGVLNAATGAQTVSIVADQAGPCAAFLFDNPILAKSPRSSLGNYMILGCLLLDGPTPVRSSTWGAVKSIYWR